MGKISSFVDFIKTRTFVSKYMNTELFIMMIISAYLFQLNKINIPIDKVLIFIAWTIGFFVVLNTNVKRALLLIATVIVVSIVFRFDTRYVTVALFGFVLFGEDINIYLPKILLINLSMFLFNLMVGYDHINGMASHLTSLIILFYLNCSQINMFNTIFVIISTFLIYWITSSEIALVSGFLLFIYMLGMRKYKQKSKMLNRLFSLSYPLSFAALYLLSKYRYIVQARFERNPLVANEFFPSIIMKIDELMTYRLSFNGRFFYPEHGFLVWGDSLTRLTLLINNDMFNIDSGLIQILSNFGYIPLIIVLFIFLLNSLYQSKHNNKFLIVTVIYAFISAFEDIPLNIGVNLSLLTLGEAMSYYLNRKDSTNDKI